MNETPASKPLITLKDVSLTIGKQVILQNISMSVPKGEIITIIGPNGAGKTSLLKIVLGITNPTEGKVEKRPNLIIGYVPQKTVIPSSVPITVHRFLTLDQKYSDDKINTALNNTGISHLLERSIHPLSGGEMQRVMLARTLLKNPELLVLDEPAQGLDPAGEEDFYALLAELNKKCGCAILMVSHDLHLVMAKSHQVICLNRHVCCNSRPNEIHSSEYAKLFGKETSELMPYSHHHDHVHLPDGSITHVVE